MVSFVQSVPWILCYLTPSINHLNSIQPFSNCGHSFELSMSSTPSMTYRVLLVVPTYLPNWLLVLPPKNGLNTCSVSIQVFLSISIDLIWSSRLKIMVNSNLNLHQRRFMILAAVHTWCDYGQNHLTPLLNSMRLRQFLGRIYFWHTSSNFQHFWLSWTLPLRSIEYSTFLV
jgi:hypothetical protein